MGLWHGVLTVRLNAAFCQLSFTVAYHSIKQTRVYIFCFLFQSVMNRIHTITVPYSVMKACPMSWVQRVHIHKGSTKCHVFHND